jgi:hypothetical protein
MTGSPLDIDALTTTFDFPRLRDYPRTPFLTPEPLENKRVPTVLGEFLRVP